MSIFKICQKKCWHRFSSKYVIYILSTYIYIYIWENISCTSKSMSRFLRILRQCWGCEEWRGRKGKGEEWGEKGGYEEWGRNEEWGRKGWRRAMTEGHNPHSRPVTCLARSAGNGKNQPGRCAIFFVRGIFFENSVPAPLNPSVPCCLWYLFRGFQGMSSIRHTWDAPLLDGVVRTSNRSKISQL